MDKKVVKKEADYTALDIAQYIIDKCTREQHPISNLQLQKILYFLQKKYLVDKGQKLFIDEIQAWQFGPVVPDVYYQYCGFGSMPITMNYDIKLEDNDEATVNPIIEEKRGKQPWDLVEETHASGKAWAEVYCEGQGNRRNIPVDLIKTKG